MLTPQELLNHFAQYRADIVLLYLQKGTNSVVKKSLEKGVVSPYENLLKKFLLDLQGEQVVAPPTPLAKKVSNAVVQQTSSTNRYELKRFLQHKNPEVVQLAQHIKASYDEKNTLFAQLLLYPNDEQRKQAAFRILALHKGIKTAYEQLFYYENNGCFAPAKVLAALPKGVDYALWTPEQLLKRKFTLRANKSRDKDKPEKVAQWQAELDEIEKHLTSPPTPSPFGEGA
jgi:hypothetical protein